MTNLSVKRHELKYYISNLEYQALVNRLIHVLTPDSHSTPRQGYFIRSLYFDSIDDECLFEKQAGTMFRKKYRMRIYDTQSDTVKFEIKHKWNNQIFKESATISRSSADEVISGNYTELLRYKNPILNNIFKQFSQRLYIPKVIIEYYRDAYIFDFFNLRVTIDKYLHSNNTDLNLFSENLHTLPVILEGKQILEIKYENALPEFIQKTLQMDSFERMAISKYTLGRRFFKLQQWEDN